MTEFRHILLLPPNPDLSQVLPRIPGYRLSQMMLLNVFTISGCGADPPERSDSESHTGTSHGNAKWPSPVPHVMHQVRLLFMEVTACHGQSAAFSVPSQILHAASWKHLPSSQNIALWTRSNLPFNWVERVAPLCLRLSECAPKAIRSPPDHMTYDLHESRSSCLST